MSDDLEQSFREDYEGKEEAMRRKMASIAEKEARVQALMAQRGGAVGRPVQQPQTQPQESDDESYGFTEHVGEIFPAAASGVGKAVSNTAEALDELWDWAGENWDVLQEVHSAAPNIPLSNDSGFQLPEAQLDTNTGKIVESASQFLTAFLPAARALKTVGMSSKFFGFLANPLPNSMVAGAAADYMAFDPQGGRLADVIHAMAPELKNPIIDYLTTDESDTAFEGRMKNVLEGSLAGAFAEGLGRILVKSVKALKGSVKDDVAEAVIPGKPQEGAEGVPPVEGPAPVKPKPIVDEAQATAEAADIRENKRFFTDTPEDVAQDIAARLAKGEDFTQMDDVLNFDYIENGDQLRNTVNAVSTHLDELLERQGYAKTQSWKDITRDSKAVLEQNGFDVRAFLDVQAETEKKMAVYTTVLRNLAVASTNKVNELANKILTGNASDLDKVKFERQLAIQAELVTAAKGSGTNLGRALNARKVIANGKMVPAELLEMSVNAAGGSEKIRKVAEKVAAMTDPKQKNEFIAKMPLAKNISQVQYYWINSILSGPQTWVVNSVSNLAVAVNSVAESAFAASKNVLTGNKGEITFGAVGDQLVGMWKGLADSLRVTSEAARAVGRLAAGGDVASFKATMGDPQNMGTAYTAFATKLSQIDPTQGSKYDYDMDPEVAKNAKGVIGKASQLLNGVIGTPGRVLMATDELFKTVHYRGYTSMMASVEGRKAGLKGAELSEFIAKYMDDPPDNITADAIKFAKYGTFQNDLGRAGRHVQGVINEVPALRFVMPFVRTPTNIIKYAVHHSPFMAVPGLRRTSKQMTEAFEAGGVQKELAEAKIATGSLLFAVAGMLAYSGKLTGGADKEFKDGTATMIGKQQYSVKIGDTYYSMSRIDPFGMFFGITADMYDMLGKMDEREWEETASCLIVALSNNLASKTYLKGIVDFTDALMGSDTNTTKAANYLTKFGASFVPNFMAQTNRIHVDEQMREINGFMDAVKARVYGDEWGSKSLAPKRDAITGEILEQNEALLGGYLPIWNQRVKNDKVLNELYRIGYAPSGPSDAILGRGADGRRASVDLDQNEKDRFHVLYTQEVKINNKNLKDFLGEIMDDPYYQHLPDNGYEQYGTRTKVGMIQKITRRYKNVARMKLMEESPTLTNKISSRLMALAQDEADN